MSGVTVNGFILLQILECVRARGGDEVVERLRNRHPDLHGGIDPESEFSLEFFTHLLDTASKLLDIEVETLSQDLGHQFMLSLNGAYPDMYRFRKLDSLVFSLPVLTGDFFPGSEDGIKVTGLPDRPGVRIRQSIDPELCSFTKGMILGGFERFTVIGSVFEEEDEDDNEDEEVLSDIVVTWEIK